MRVLVIDSGDSYASIAHALMSLALTDCKLTETRIQEIKLPDLKDFNLDYIALPKNEREPWRRGRPIRK